MLVFRSKEHIDEWCERTGHPFGASFPLQTMWRLSRAWYHDRLDEHWRRMTAEETRHLFSELGLTSDFWSL